MRPAEGAAAAVLDRPPGSATAAQGAESRRDVAPELAVYHVLLLAGEPRRHTCTLPAGIEAGSDVEVAGEMWTVADVRSGGDGAAATLVCIYAV